MAVTRVPVRRVAKTDIPYVARNITVFNTQLRRISLKSTLLDAPDAAVMAKDSTAPKNDGTAYMMKLLIKILKNLTECSLPARNTDYC